MSRIVVLTIAAALVATSACGGGDGTSDEDEVREFVERQITLFKAADWPALYDTYSPDARAACSYEEFLAVYEGVDPVDLQSLVYEDLQITVDGDRATASYVVTRGGEEIERASADAYVKVDGEWYDELDADTPC
jgi:hypothetical protein